MGYNRTVRIDLDDLGEGLYVEIRNPKILTEAQLNVGRAALGHIPDGQVPTDEQAAAAGAAVIASIIRDWNLSDPEDERDDAPVLPLPCTPDTVRRLPIAVTARIAEVLNEATNPR